MAGVSVLARRSRIGIRPAALRLEAYKAGVSAGDSKYEAKLDIMKKHKDAAFAVIYEVQELAKRYADENGVTGTARTVFVKVAERLAHFAIKYHGMSDNDVRDALNSEIDIELATSGMIRDVTVPAAVYDRMVSGLRAMIDEILAKRREWYDTYLQKLTS